MSIRISQNGIWLGSRGSGQAKKLKISRVLPPIVALFMVAATIVVNYATRDQNLIPILSIDGPARKPVLKIIFGDLMALTGSLIQASPPPQNNLVESYRLMADENAIPEILKNELRRGESSRDRTYYPALLWSDLAGWQKSKITVRGSSAWHHTPEKPSLRIKIARSEQAGRKFLEVSRPEDPLALCNWLPDQIGETLGLMTARTKPVRLSLNGKFLGLYLDTYRLGEPLALANSRLPGTFFQGENINGEVGLWMDPKLWESRGEDDPAAQKRFEAFLSSIGQWTSSPNDVVHLFEHVDRDKLAAWSALLTFSSSSHSDDFHNQLFFYNTYRGLFEPVVWDVNGFGVLMEATAHPDLIINLLQNSAYSDPRFLHLRNEYLWEMLQDSGSILETARKDVARILPDLNADTSLGGIGPLWPEAPRGFPFHISAQLVYRQTKPKEIPRHLEEFEEFFQQRMKHLTAYFQEASFSVEKTDSGSRVTVFGNVAIEVRSQSRDLDYSRLDYSPGRSTLLYPGRRHGGMASDLLRPIAVLSPAPLIYDFDNAPDELEFFHAHSKQPLSPSTRPPLTTRGHSIHPAYFFPKPHKTVALGPGLVEIKEDLVVPAENTLEIAPGTNLRIGPGVQIVCFGKAHLEGTPEAPITLDRLDPRVPWGSLSFVGQESVVLRGLQIRGGSLSRYRGYSFKGMVNAYQVGLVNMENCQVFRNETGDDAVNMANSEVDIQSCQFTDARSDALDLDRCRGKIRDCRFSNAGNDGLDLSHAELLVQDCQFQGCGDKGISVGEKSSVELKRLEIENCVIGVQCKDESQTRISASTLTENGIGLSAYRKKKIFMRGGTILTKDLDLKSNGTEIDQQSRSVIATVD